MDNYLVIPGDVCDVKPGEVWVLSGYSCSRYAVFNNVALYNPKELRNLSIIHLTLKSGFTFIEMVEFLLIF